MKVYLPEINAITEDYKIFKPNNTKEYLQNIYKLKKESSGVRVFNNKPPVWNECKLKFIINLQIYFFYFLPF
jgi:hypothetical protein